MTEYDNELTGVIFKEKEKKTENHPDYWGKTTIKGVEYKLAGWIKQGPKGAFISFKLTPPETVDDYKPEPVIGDDVPF